MILQWIFILICCCFSYVLMIDCSGKPDGIYEAGCKTFVTCTNGVATTTECYGNQVFNPETKKCDDPINVAPPCGNIINCTDIPDGQYPDFDQFCSSYYTCKDGLFHGHNFCPAGLVFNEEKGYCDWQQNVFVPCGLVPRP